LTKTLTKQMEKPVRRRAFLFNLFIMLMVPKAGLHHCVAISASY
jgi:hypothetical protein